jgi:hypothetical protein
MAGLFGGPSLSATASSRPGRVAVTTINREYSRSVTVNIRAPEARSHCAPRGKRPGRGVGSTEFSRWNGTGIELARWNRPGFGHGVSSGAHPDDAGHRRRGRRFPEHRVAGPHRRAERDPDQPGDAGADPRGRAADALPPQPVGPRPARRPHDAAGRDRARNHGPVLRRRRRRHLHRGQPARLQRRPGRRPRPHRRSHRPARRPGDAPLRRDPAPRRHERPAAPARGSARHERPGRRAVAGHRPGIGASRSSAWTTSSAWAA